MNNLLYVCSPYRGDTKRNKDYARKLTRTALDNGFVPVTVHLYLTEVTDDQNQEERRRGMAAGMAILESCKYILVGDKYGISEGTKAEMTLAALKGIIMLYEKDGSYDMNNAFAESRLAAMLHIADMMATHLDEREVKAE